MADADGRNGGTSSTSGLDAPEVRFVIEDDSVRDVPRTAAPADDDAARAPREGRIGRLVAASEEQRPPRGDRASTSTPTRPGSSAATASPTSTVRTVDVSDASGNAGSGGDDQPELPGWLAGSDAPTSRNRRLPLRSTAGDDLLDLQVRHLLVTVVFGVLTTAGLIVIANTAVGRSLSLYYPVAIVGSLGGTAHTYRRLRAHADADAEVLAAIPRSLAIAQVYLSPIIGAAFAVVLHTIFVGGLLQGEVFPTFTCAGDAYDNYARFADCGPSTNSDVALALVWAFLAGFAEHWVPTLLDGLVPKSED